MTTKLKLNTVRREVQATTSERLIVSLTPSGITTREKGRRTEYGPIPYAHLHLIGARMRAADVMKERAAKRKRRK